MWRLLPWAAELVLELVELIIVWLAVRLAWFYVKIAPRTWFWHNACPAGRPFWWARRWAWCLIMLSIRHWLWFCQGLGCWLRCMVSRVGRLHNAPATLVQTRLLRGWCPARPVVEAIKLDAFATIDRRMVLGWGGSFGAHQLAWLGIDLR